MPRGSKSHQFEEDVLRELSDIKDRLTQRQSSGRNLEEEFVKGLQDIKKYLGEISEKLSNIDETMKKVQTEHFPEKVSETIQAMKTTADSLKNIEGIFNQRQNQVDENILRDSTELSFKREAERIKQSTIQKWNEALRNRRIQFWNMIKNRNKAEVYLNWLESSPITLPRKLQFREIPDEPEQQRRRREKLAMDQFQAEIDLLQMRGKVNEDRFQNTDLEMEQLLESKTQGNILKNVLELWRTECQQEEEISEQRWKKTQAWLEKYKKEFSENNKNNNPFVKKIQKPADSGTRNDRVKKNISTQQRNYRRPNFQNPNRYNETYNYEYNNRSQNTRPQIPYKERYDRRNFSNLRTYERNRDTLQDFVATQQRFLDQRQRYTPYR